MRPLVFHLVLTTVFSVNLARSIEAGEAVAIVVLQRNENSVKREASSATQSLDLMDRLFAGDIVETGPKAEIVMVFSNGKRYRMTPQSRASIEPGQLKRLDGVIDELDPVPEMVELAPLLLRSSRAGAIRIRQTVLPRLGDSPTFSTYPSGGAPVFSDGAVLRFSPIQNVSKYQVDLEDEVGKSLLSLETSSTEVAIQPGVLEPDSQYYWRVRTIGGPRPAVRGDAVFSTATETQASAWMSLTKRDEANDGDVSLHLLLAMIDQTLGRPLEACRRLDDIRDPSLEKLINRARSSMECKP